MCWGTRGSNNSTIESIIGWFDIHQLNFCCFFFGLVALANLHCVHCMARLCSSQHFPLRRISKWVKGIQKRANLLSFEKACCTAMWCLFEGFIGIIHCFQWSMAHTHQKKKKKLCIWTDEIWEWGKRAFAIDSNH